MKQDDLPFAFAIDEVRAKTMLALVGISFHDCFDCVLVGFLFHDETVDSSFRDSRGVQPLHSY